MLALKALDDYGQIDYFRMVNLLPKALATRALPYMMLELEIDRFKVSPSHYDKQAEAKLLRAKQQKARDRSRGTHPDVCGFAEASPYFSAPV